MFAWAPACHQSVYHMLLADQLMHKSFVTRASIRGQGALDSRGRGKGGIFCVSGHGKVLKNRALSRCRDMLSVQQHVKGGTFTQAGQTIA